MFLRRLLCTWLTVIFTSTLIIPPQWSWAQTVLDLPTPGAMVSVSSSFKPALIRGLTVHKDNPFLFDFIVDPGDSLPPMGRVREGVKEQADRMIKYFFAALTIPDKDIWVNLSPYEKDRMVPESLGQTAMGRDLLAQDYMLKQLTASLIYPQRALGKEFWDKVYTKAKEMYGTTNIPVNTFNKVWIVPQKAGIYEHGQTAFIIDGHLKVMLEEDYLSLTKHQGQPGDMASSQVSSLSSQVIRQLILPEIEREVNEGKNFATLRQIFYAQVLAVWFKRNLKQALLNQVYANKSTIKGIIGAKARQSGEQIYQQYLKAYKKGVFNFIQDDKDPVTQETLPRKYFSGGYGDSALLSIVPEQLSTKDMASISNDIDFSVLTVTAQDAAMTVKKGFNLKLGREERFFSSQELQWHLGLLQALFNDINKFVKNPKNINKSGFPKMITIPNRSMITFSTQIELLKSSQYLKNIPFALSHGDQRSYASNFKDEYKIVINAHTPYINRVVLEYNGSKKSAVELRRILIKKAEETKEHLEKDIKEIRYIADIKNDTGFLALHYMNSRPVTLKTDIHDLNVFNGQQKFLLSKAGINNVKNILGTTEQKLREGGFHIGDVTIDRLRAKLAQGGFILKQRPDRAALAQRVKPDSAMMGFNKPAFKKSIITITLVGLLGTIVAAARIGYLIYKGNQRMSQPISGDMKRWRGLLQTLRAEGKILPDEQVGRFSVYSAMNIQDIARITGYPNAQELAALNQIKSQEIVPIAPDDVFSVLIPGRENENFYINQDGYTPAGISKIIWGDERYKNNFLLSERQADGKRKNISLDPDTIIKNGSDLIIFVNGPDDNIFLKWSKDGEKLSLIAPSAFPGGIDLTTQDQALHVEKDINGGVKVNVDPDLIARIEREGMSELIPVIINMQPADIHSLFDVKV